MWEEILIFGTVQGAVLALLALGFSLVYGVGGILNLSHGAFYLIACYTIYWALPTFGIALSMVIGIGVIALIGAVSYIALIKPLEKTPIGVLLVTFALAFFFEQFVRLVAPTYKFIPPLLEGSVKFLGITFAAQFILILLGTLILIVSVMLIIKKTTIGKSIQAVAQDSEAAKLMGINTSKIFLISIIISALLVGGAAALYAPGNVITPQMGWGYLLSAFAVTIFGGMGSISGSILGAFIMGYLKTFTQYMPFLGPTYAELVPIVVILIMLLVRPQGLLGKKEVRI